MFFRVINNTPIKRVLKALAFLQCFKLVNWGFRFFDVMNRIINRFPFQYIITQPMLQRRPNQTEVESSSTVPPTIFFLQNLPFGTKRKNMKKNFRGDGGGTCRLHSWNLQKIWVEESIDLSCLIRSTLQH